MDHRFESNLDKVSEEMLRYVGVTNLDFRSSLSDEDLKEVQRMLFSINTLIQVSFKDDVNVSDIENVKHLIELSPMCDDRKIEKIILRENTKEEVEKLLSMPYVNPDTWHITYDIKDGTYMITTLPNYRVMEEYINIVLSCVKEDMSSLEKVKEVYDFVKLLDYDENGSVRLPDIIKSRKTNSLGFNLLFLNILNRIGFYGYIGEVIRDGKKEYVTLLSIEDDKYDIDGIYVFDPSSDSIPKKFYKSEAIRKVNYNFFGLTLNQVVNTKDNDSLGNILSLLKNETSIYALKKLDRKDKKKLENSFNISIDDLFSKIARSKTISEDKILRLIIDTVHKEDFLGLNRNLEELLTNNYQLRKKEIFKEEDTKDINRLNLHDI